MTTITNINSPVWGDAQHTHIMLFMTVNGAATQTPYAANPTDPEPLGRQLYAQAVAGDFGAIAPYVETPATKAELVSYASQKATALLSAMRAYTDTASGATIKSDATPSTIANLMALMQWGAANPTATDNWISNDGGVTMITGAEIAAIAKKVGAYAQLIYGTELAAVLGEISSAVITSTAQIDSYGWSV